MSITTSLTLSCWLVALVSGCAGRVAAEVEPTDVIAATPSIGGDASADAFDTSVSSDARVRSDASDAFDVSTGDAIAPTMDADGPHDWSTGALCDRTVGSGWRPMTSFASLDLDARTVTDAVWSGKEMLVVAKGADDCDFSPCAPTQVIAAYDPATDRWRIAATILLFAYTVSGRVVSLGGASLARIDFYNSTVWVSHDLARVVAAPLERASTCVTDGAAVAYAPSTNELVMWGGGYEEDGPTWVRCAQGIALRDGVTRVLAPPPATMRGGHASAVWMGTSLLVIGWDDARAAIYEPDFDRWTDLGALPKVDPRDAPIAMGRLGTHVAFFGGLSFDGDDESFVALDGASYDLETASWMRLAPPPLTAKGDRWRDDPAWWMQPGPSGDDEIAMFGGFGEHEDFLSDVVAVDTKTGAWRTVSSGGGLGPRSGVHAVWDGCEAIIYGGAVGPAWLSDGALFKP